ncbi:hypothetical protein KY289_016424 [Solanum tuberosum]|nr:hypothetical protein KY289_016424 [Solanum tuberosum]
MDEESFNKYTRIKAIKDFSEKIRLKRNRVGFVKMWVGKLMVGGLRVSNRKDLSSTWLLRILNWVDNSIYGIIQTVVTRYIDP